MFLTLAAYFGILLAMSYRGRKSADNDAFFRAGRRSSWPMVAFGMIGASVSGVSLVSVPGWVASTQMSYLQMCAGFFFGYVAVAFVLLPVYYRLRLTSIYAYLGQRFGPHTHRTGALFFLLSKLTGAAARLYIAVLVLQTFLADPIGMPFPLTAALTLLLIWLYTRRSGIQTIVRTDAVQTLCLLLAIVGILWAVCHRLDLNLAGMIETVRESPMSRVFVWDADSPQNFWRQFLSGIFIVIVMTGLDQDMMQKNLTCRTLRDAQKDMCCYGACFLPVNLLLLTLGVLLYTLCERQGIAAPAAGDQLLPTLVASGALGTLVIIPFSIGIIAAAFSSADSALTALTTTCCIDLLGIEADGHGANAERVRKSVHIGMAVLFLGCMLLFRAINSRSAIDAIYTMASYTYGPLLGLYAFGLFSKVPVRDRLVPLAAVAAPLVCALLDWGAPRWWGYRFGYELLMLNGALTFAMLWALKKSKETSQIPNESREI